MGFGVGVWGLGFGVWGLGFWVWGLEFGALGLGFEVLKFVGSDLEGAFHVVLHQCQEQR